MAVAPTTVGATTTVAATTTMAITAITATTVEAESAAKSKFENQTWAPLRGALFLLGSLCRK